MLEYQSKLGDPEVEKKLRNKVRKYKTLLQDLSDELEHEREMRGNSAMVKSLRNQLEDLQASEQTAVKAQKRLQDEVDELQMQSDELSRIKMEVQASSARTRFWASLITCAHTCKRSSNRSLCQCVCMYQCHQLCSYSKSGHPRNRLFTWKA